jgi:hypothetical protein
MKKRSKSKKKSKKTKNSSNLLYKLLKKNKNDGNTKSNEFSTVINEVETFLNNNKEELLKSHGIGWWRACILTFSDKYGSIGVLNEKKFKPKEKLTKTTCKNLIKIILKVRKNLQWLRYKLGTREDQERIQMQRPIMGPSLLSITQSCNRKSSSSLNTLLVCAIHPKYGIDEYRLSEDEYNSVPFKLPKLLQPVLPDLPLSDEMVVVAFATEINNMIKNIYKLKSNINAPDVPQSFKDFFKRFNLNETWHEFKNLPSVFNTESYFQTVVPKVKAGKQILIWKTWHSTVGSKKDKNAKMTAFIDLVPKTFLDEDELEFYKYMCKNSPCDFGAGSSRGSYQTFRYLNNKYNKAIKNGVNVDDFNWGFDESIMKQLFSTPLIDSDFILNDEEKDLFDEQGYLVIDIPDDLQKKCPTDEVIDNFSNFFKVISDDSNFDFRDYKSLRRSEINSESENFWKHFEKESAYHYYTRRINENDPLNPDSFKNDDKKIKEEEEEDSEYDSDDNKPLPVWKLKKKKSKKNDTGKKDEEEDEEENNNKYSHNAQKGGKLISADSGMGPGTTFLAEPNHIKFQFSDFVTGVMQSFYGQQSLIRIPERFRVKTESAWKKNTHVDVSGKKFIPTFFNNHFQ